MKLIYEMDSLEQDTNVINESDGSRRYTISGVFSTIGEPNRNKRIYSKYLWEREVAKYQEIMCNGSVNSLMEYKHPPRSSVDQMAAVGKVMSLSIEGKYVMGEAVILDNPDDGKTSQLKTLIDNNIKISVSSRGLGEVGKNGMVKEFGLITYDIVPDPSDFNATMNGMSEGMMMNEGILQGFNFDASGNIVDTKQELSESDKAELNAEFMKKFMNILK